MRFQDPRIYLPPEQLYAVFNFQWNLASLIKNKNNMKKV